MTGGFALSDPVLPSQLPRQTGGRRGERLLAVAMPDQCRLDLRALEAGAPCNGLIASSARPPPRARGLGSFIPTVARRRKLSQRSAGSWLERAQHDDVDRLPGGDRRVGRDDG